MLPPLAPSMPDIATAAQSRGRAMGADGRSDPALCGALLLAQLDLGAGAAPDRARTELILSLLPLCDPATLALAARRVADGADVDPRLVGALRAVRDQQPPPPADDTLEPHRLRQMVEEARGDRALARRLLDRSEPTVRDRAALYRFATAPERAAIRLSLAQRLGPDGAGPAFLAGTGTLRDTPPAALAGILAERGIGPSAAAVAAGLVDEAEQELFAFALLALGIAPDEAIRFLLAQPPAISHSVATFEALVKLLRSVPVATARFLADPDNLLGTLAARGPTELRADDGARRGAAHRIRPVGATLLRPREGASALPDRRSRSTTGRDRT